MRNLLPINRLLGMTVPIRRKVKVGATVVEMWPLAEHKGVLAHPIVQTICELAGITTLGCKVRGSMNRANVVRATLKCINLRFFI